MDNYMEYMVKKKMDSKDALKRSLCFAVIVSLFAAWFLFSGVKWLSIVCFVLGIAMCVITKIFVFPATDLEYEYLYCDKQITIDKIMGKEKRKNLAVYDTGRIELMCAVNDYHADEFKNRKVTVKDYTTGIPSEDYETYVIFYEGNLKILLDLPYDFVKMIQNTSPRKVFISDKMKDKIKKDLLLK